MHNPFSFRCDPRHWGIGASILVGYSCTGLLLNLGPFWFQIATRPKF